MFRINVFGRFQMLAEDSTPISFPARSASAVLALLVLHKGRAVSRKELAKALWPDQYADAARTNLRTALHRIRKSLVEQNPLIVEEETVRLDLSLVASDVADADRLHRTFLLAPNQPDGIEALSGEWELRKQPLLEGWEDEWVEAWRGRFWISTNEIGCELGRVLESADGQEKALQVWREILDRVPHHAEALKHALRLEFQVNGKAQALELAKEMSLRYELDTGIEMPKDLQRTVKDIRAGFLEPVAQPEFVRKRSELFLLARMFESNLRENRREALAMLAKECTQPMAHNHPRAMLGLLTLALNETDGVSAERLEVAAQAVILASWASEFDVGHRWADYVIESTQPGNPLYGGAMSMKGFMFFEQRQYEEARVCLDKAIKAFDEHDQALDKIRASSRLAGLQWHQMHFEEAIEMYKAVIEAARLRTDEARFALLAMANGNLSFVHCMVQRWTDAVAYGLECEKFAGSHPVYGFVFPIPLGLALYASGEKARGQHELAKAVSVTCREGMLRFNQIAIDFAAVAFAIAEKIDVARYVLEANSDHRAALLHMRSPAEHQMIQLVTGFDPDLGSGKTNQLKGQSMSTLSEWVCDELGRLS